MDKSINVMNLIAYPCVIKNDQGNPTYGLLIRPSSSTSNDKAADNEDCNILDIQQQQQQRNIASPPNNVVLRNQVFIPASAVPNFQQKFCNGGGQESNNKQLSEYNQQTFCAGENSNLYSGNELQHILDEIDTSDISSFLQELSYDSHELIHDISSSQLEIMDPMPSNMLADRLVLHHEQQQLQQQPCCSKYVEPSSCRYQATKHAPPNDPPPAPHAPDPHIVVYHDVGTPDSGIQSIGESPRALMQNSPAQHLPNNNVYNNNNSNPFFAQSPIPAPPAHHRSSLMEPLMINIESKFAAPSSKNVDFEDMPRLEPENDESSKIAQEIHDQEAENTNKLLDRILSSLPVEQLANVSKLLDKKLKACSQKEKTPDLEKNVADTVKNQDAAAKKLADYRQKMKQKRENEKLFREIENLCDRLNNITSDQ
uniref:Uncharacterized protein n=1 Tax=Romanomermis culicivorax TaxID=13658 RepID=A0A915KHK9_ROMCU